MAASADDAVIVDQSVHEFYRTPVVITDREKAMQFDRFVRDTIRRIDNGSLAPRLARELWNRAIIEAQPEE
jgi:hypothetical protein